jgi:hypothetical protein
MWVVFFPSGGREVTKEMEYVQLRVSAEKVNFTARMCISRFLCMKVFCRAAFSYSRAALKNYKTHAHNPNYLGG